MMTATAGSARLPLVALLLSGGLGSELSGGCIVDDPSYLGPATTSNSGSASSSSPSGSGAVTNTDVTGLMTSLGTGTGPLSTTPTDDTTGCLQPSRGWWDTDWSYRRQLTFNNSGQAEDLANFTVLVVLPGDDVGDSHTAPEGADLRFLDDDQATVLAHEVERWDPSGESYVWVEVPVIDGGSVDDHIWLYYDNPMAADVQDPSGAWDDAHVGVWHLEENTGTHQDSTSGMPCSWEGGGSQDAPGRIAGAVDFDGNEDNIDCGIGQIADTEYHTITAWVRLDLLGDENQQIINVESADPPYRGIGLYVERETGAIGKRLHPNLYYAQSTDNRVSADQWSLLAIRGRQVNVGGYVEVSRNGGPWEALFTGNTHRLEIENGNSLLIGNGNDPSVSTSTRGIIDEVRISNVARSDDWVRAQYLSDTQQLISTADAQTLCP